MSRRLLIALGALVVLGLAIGGPLAIAITDKTKGEQRTPPLDLASAAVQRFLDGYVEPDGRVVRRDQGGDVVSEGQAYAMLASVAIGDRTRFDSVWSWTRANMLQPSGLLAWRWQNGQILDAQPASDADMDAARALAVAADRFKDDKYAEQAKTLAAAIADHEFGMPAGLAGQPILLGGPWANKAPFYSNPSYHSPRTEEELAKLTGDKRWVDVETQERLMTASLLGPANKKANLPPDWALVQDSGAVAPTVAPGDKSDSPKYSYDAIRLPVRLAESCDASDKAQAARLWNVLNQSQDSQWSPGMSLDGQITDHSQSAIGAVGSAAAAHAAGDDDAMLRLLDVADRVSVNQRTYYGSAWSALGRVMLTTNWLGDCPTK